MSAIPAPLPRAASGIAGCGITFRRTIFEILLIVMRLAVGNPFGGAAATVLGGPLASTHPWLAALS